MSPRITRNAVVSLLGTPDRTEGSLNDPIERDEHGLRFNEKWSYSRLRSDPAGVPMREIYWHRYDFTGTTVRENEMAQWRHDDSLIESLKTADGRLASIDDHHKPLAGNARYLPASEVKDSLDLGGYIQGRKPD